MNESELNTLIKRLEKAVELGRELERIADKVTPMLQLIDKLGKDAILPQLSDRLIGRGEVREALKVGNAAISTLIRNGNLTPLYIANARSAKFRISEVERIINGLNKEVR